MFVSSQHSYTHAHKALILHDYSDKPAPLPQNPDDDADVEQCRGQINQIVSLSLNVSGIITIIQGSESKVEVSKSQNPAELPGASETLLSRQAETWTIKPSGFHKGLTGFILCGFMQSYKGFSMESYKGFTRD